VSLINLEIPLWFAFTKERRRNTSFRIVHVGWATWHPRIGGNEHTIEIVEARHDMGVSDNVETHGWRKILGEEHKWQNSSGGRGAGMWRVNVGMGVGGQ